MFHAVDIQQRHHISYWDAAIIAAAEELGAPTVYTEDLNHGQKFASITVVNPFLNIPSSRQAAP
jgi:predicted nucleic acid-binding protein